MTTYVIHILEGRAVEYFRGVSTVLHGWCRGSTTLHSLRRNGLPARPLSFEVDSLMDSNRKDGDSEMWTCRREKSSSGGPGALTYGFA